MSARSIQPLYIIAAFAVLKFLVPFLGIDPAYALHRDEYLYLAGSLHPDWGYLEAPPLMSWLGRISLWLGGSMNAVRLWGALFGAAHIFLLGKMVLALGGRGYACLLACLAFFTGGTLRMHILFQPNMADIFAWTLAAYLLVRLIQTSNHRYLYGLALAFAFGWYAKYSIVFFGVPTALAFLLFRNLRSWLSGRHAWQALVLFVLLIAPNLWWQASHGYPVLVHMKLLQERLLVHVSRSGFLVNQLLMNLPGVPVWIAGICWLLSARGRLFRPVLFIYAGVIALLLFSQGKDYYAMGVYPMLMAFGGVAIERWTEDITTRNRLLRAGTPALILLLFGLVLPLLLPIAPPQALARYFKERGLEKTGALTWERGDVHELPQDYADMLGWKELAEKTAAVYHRLPDSVRSKTLIFGDQYAYAGPVQFFGRRLGLPEIYSDDASFMFWLPKTFPYRHILLIDKKPRSATDAVFGRFNDYQVLDSMTTPYARENGVKLFLYRNGDDSLANVAEKAIAEGKRPYRMD